METLCATWTVTWNSLTLLTTETSTMAAEPKWAHRHALQIVPYLRADAVVIFDRLNIEHGLTISRIDDYDTAGEARAAIMDHLAELSELGAATMTIEVSVPAVDPEDPDVIIEYEMLHAALSDVDPETGPKTGKAGRVVWRYQFKGGKLQEVVAP
jgi:hypothetical protein